MRPAEHRACLLLGSNIQPERNLPRAVELLRPRVRLLQASSVWETPPVGSPGPDFLNAALLVATALDAPALKEQVLLPLEARLGRVRSADKNAPRPIDLDLVTFDGRCLDPNLWKYAHRAIPVAEILPELQSEAGGTLQEAAARLAEVNPLRPRPDVVIPLQEVREP